MKILLLQPNYDAHIIHPPLGLGYLASYLRQFGHKVSIFDGTLKNAQTKDYLRQISDGNPDIVGISFLTRAHKQVRKLTEAIKDVYSSLPIVLGGTQVTALPKEIMSTFRADFAVLGEGEETFRDLIENIEQDSADFSQIDGLSYRSEAKTIINKPRALISDLDSLPFPAWDLMPPANYRIVPILEPAKSFPIAPIMTSRGCPYNCSFCASNVTWQRRIRFRSPANVLAEILMLKEDFGVKEIHFADDNFTMNIERAAEICDLLIQEEVNLPWQCPNGVRIDRLTLPLLKKMKASGCYALGLGIESADPKILARAGKKLDLKIVPEVLANIKKAGIESNGFFILGLPGDNKKSIQKTINFALNQPFDRAWFNIFTPYPGSPAFNDWLGERSFASIDWDKHDCSTAVVTTKDLSFKDLERWQKKALFQFYFRPRILWLLFGRLRFRELSTFFMTRFFKSIKRVSTPYFSDFLKLIDEASGK